MIYKFSDLHIGHNTVWKWRPFKDERHHSLFMMFLLIFYTTRKSVYYNTGDFVFNRQYLTFVNKLFMCIDKMYYMPGNHCFERTKTKEHSYIMYDNVELHGLLKKNKIWYSHSPMSIEQVGKLFNVHGHVHSETESSKKYLNICMESDIMKYDFITLDKINQIITDRSRDDFDESTLTINNYLGVEDKADHHLGMINSNKHLNQIYNISLSMSQNDQVFNDFMESFQLADTEDKIFALVQKWKYAINNHDVVDILHCKEFVIPNFQQGDHGNNGPK